MNWQPGDLAITCNLSTASRNGLIVEIVRVSPEWDNGDYIIKCPGVLSYKQDGCWSIHHYQLKPLPDDENDVNQMVSWDELADIYQPKELEKVS